MTRIVSVLGVATVATLVLLSGCGSAVKPDYTKQLDGTWQATGLMVPTPTDPPVLVPTDVTLVIDDGEGLNTGTFELTVTQMIPGSPDAVSKGSGSVRAESSSVMKVTLTDLMSAPGIPEPPTVTALKDVAQTVHYERSGNELTLSSSVFINLAVTTITMPELILTKQ